MDVLILEDENLTANRLESLLHRYDPGIRVLAKIPSVSQAVAWLRAHPIPDLMFTDIHLEDDLVFSLFEQATLSVPMIFTTAYDAYVIQAFKVSSIDYLLKPINYHELVGAMEKYKSFQQHFQRPNLDSLLSLIQKPAEAAFKERFMITIGSRIRSVATEQVLYFFVEDKATFLTTEDGLHLPVEYSVDKLTQLLDPKRFFRINRQYLISLASIGSIHAYSGGKLKLDLYPRSRHEVFVSGDRVAEFKTWLGK